MLNPFSEINPYSHQKQSNFLSRLIYIIGIGNIKYQSINNFRVSLSKILFGNQKPAQRKKLFCFYLFVLLP